MFFILITLFILLFFPEWSRLGASSGLLLWFQQLMPSMLPFLILAKLLINTGLHKTIGKFLYPLLHPLLGLSSSGCFALLLGTLSGLPLGADTISGLYLNHEISKKEGILLLCLCSNPSPMFLISYAGISQLKHTNNPYLVFWLIFLSSLVYFYIMKLILPASFQNTTFEQTPVRPRAAATAVLPSGTSSSDFASSLASPFSFSLLSDCILSGFQTITSIGGYLMLFGIYSSCLAHLLPKRLPILLRLLPILSLEMTTGVAEVCKADLSPFSSLFLVTLCCCFGGLSGLAQTKSVLASELITFPRFLLLKLGHTLTAGTLTLFYFILFL